MPHIDFAAYNEIKAACDEAGVTLVAVSKKKPVAAIRELYELGHRDFGENYVQELIEKQPQLPDDIRWHFVGHLQRNKVKLLTPFVHLIHGVDSMRLLEEIDKRGQDIGRIVDVLLQVHVAREDTKHGFTPDELREQFADPDIHRQAWARLSGIMGMGTFSDDYNVVGPEFATLKTLFDELSEKYFDRRPEWHTLSMGMSGDYRLAIEKGSTLVRVGSAIFGARD